MKDLMILMSDVLPKEEIIKQIDEAIQKWKVDPTNENVNGVEMWSMMLLSKKAAEECGGSDKLIAKTDLQKKALDLLSPTEQ